MATDQNMIYHFVRGLQRSVANDIMNVGIPIFFGRVTFPSKNLSSLQKEAFW